MPRTGIAVFALLVCLLAAAAAAVSFAQGSLVGIVWVLLAGLCSNMALYYYRKAKGERAARRG
ncbi:hypothetical protein AQ490_12585 [Wenjunlia vitaminophila]|uniref:Secreted protein n=1 Tax=Wenjunlia vitaminophila TaxID=76728 RepID=A0A0T6LKQ9_WENVI|nr:hypothetical protein [Wenjunlia vitaminophila]KRV46695.1 hypothetical protein AQ490_12585 [Wenjunlia vitaminophila]